MRRALPGLAAFRRLDFGRPRGLLFAWCLPSSRPACCCCSLATRRCREQIACQPGNIDGVGQGGQEGDHGPRQGARAAKGELDRADAAAGRRDGLRQREQSGDGQGQRRDLLRQLHAACRSGHLRPQRQHAGRRRQRPHQGSRGRHHHLGPHDADRRFPRRLHRRAAGGDQGRYADRGHQRHARGGQRHGVR